VVSDTLTTMSGNNRGFFLDKSDIVWGYDNKVNIAGVTSYKDSTTSKNDYAPGTISGGGSAAGGVDLDGNVWFARDPDGSAILTKGVLATIPIFTTIEVRDVGDTTIDMKVISDSNSTAYLVALPQGSPAPSPAQIIAGTDSFNVPVPSGHADSVELVENVENGILTFAATNLNQLTNYDIYVVSEGSGGIQVSPTIESASTTSSNPIDQDSLAFKITVGGLRVF